MQAATATYRLSTYTKQFDRQFFRNKLSYTSILHYETKLEYKTFGNMAKNLQVLLYIESLTLGYDSTGPHSWQSSTHTCTMKASYINILRQTQLFPKRGYYGWHMITLCTAKINSRAQKGLKTRIRSICQSFSPLSLKLYKSIEHIHSKN